MKFNTLNSNNCLGFSTDTLESKYQDNADSLSYSTSCNTMKQNFHKSCDTIDHNSGLNYYALHSIISYAVENNNNKILNKASITNTKTYELHDGKRNDISFDNINCYRYNIKNGLCKANQNSPIGNRLYISVKIDHTKNDCNKLGYIIVKHLPCLYSYSFNDDSVHDPLMQYFNDCFAIKNYLNFMCQKQIVSVVANVTGVSQSILVSNISHYFTTDFKQYNFNVQFVNY